MNLRVHGDNVLECEHAARIIAAALGGREPLQLRLLDSPLWAPKYGIGEEQHPRAHVQLFPGYGRWPFDIQKELRRRGAPLREMADAVVTVLGGRVGRETENPLMAFEFCGALPAGNQAWQRCGRSLNAAYPKIPYFYFAELGGVELDANRRVKAGRLPNPIIPFAYLALGDALATIALPVFEPSPSIQDDARRAFADTFSEDETVVLVNSILTGNYNAGEERELREKAIRAAAALTGLRRRRDTLSAEEWEELANERSGRDKARWLVARAMPWRKKVTIPVTATFRTLLMSVQRMAVAIGTEELPICLLSGAERRNLAEMLVRLHAARIAPEFLAWLRTDKPLVMVWIAGFKPAWEDSRPDRGLVPLARMIFGEGEVDVLSVVYGPGRSLQQVITNPAQAAETNGLWEAILRFSNAVLIDSLNGESLRQISMLVPGKIHAKPTHVDGTAAGSENPLDFGENDVDTVLHLIFAHALRSTCFECMCNPPGGDWSGMSFKLDRDILRWTSLPRVTAEGAKRPDHVVQFYAPNAALLAIESKDDAAVVESGIGPRLVEYVSSLLAHPPNILRGINDNLWKPALDAGRIVLPPVISAAAFQHRNASELRDVERRAACDLVLGFEFDRVKGRTVAHVKVNRQLDWLVTFIQTAANNLSRRLIVQIH